MTRARTKNILRDAGFRVPLFLLACVAIMASTVLLTAISCASAAKNEDERAIFTNDVVEIHGKNAGLPNSAKNIYLIPFSDHLDNPYLMNEFSTRFRFTLEGFGLRLTERIKGSDAVIVGSVDTLTIANAERITNNDALYYKLTIRYSVLDRSKNYLEKDRLILEEVLVMDTNTYDSNKVVLILAQNAARHTAEAVVNGWQSEYSRTADAKIFTLGVVTNATNNSTNRAQ